MFEDINNMMKAIECHEKALAIATEIGHKQSQGVCYELFGRLYVCLRKCVIAEENLEKGLS